MTPKQIAYFNNLPPKNQLALKAAALHGTFTHEREIANIFSSNTSMSQKFVRECIEEAMKMELVRRPKNDYFYGNGSYEINPSFIVFVAPELTNFESQYDVLTRWYNYSFYTSTRNMQLIGRMFYCLFHNEKEFEKLQQEFLALSERYYLFEMSELFDYAIYRDKLKKISPRFLSDLFFARKNIIIGGLRPLKELFQLWTDISPYLPLDVHLLLSTDVEADFHFGKFSFTEKSDTKSFYAQYSPAIKSLTDGDIKTSISLFNKAIKNERKIRKGALIPPNVCYAIYYLIAVLRLESDESALLCKKILDAINKKSYSSFDNYFKSILYNALNEKDKKDAIITDIFLYLQNGFIDLTSLALIIVAFLSEAKPEKALLPNMLKTVRKAIESEYYALAYEAAYALKMWFDSSETDSLFVEAEKKLNYQAAISRIARHEAWEKSLNLLLGLSAGKQAKTAKEKEASSRVIYLLKPDKGEIQPTLQTRTAKGTWTMGRNIALKTFFQGKTPGMTEQDLRISKTIKQDSDYYYGGGASYFFTERVWVELAGHPYLFLMGGKEIPVQLIAAQPEIKVAKTSKGYILKADIENSDKSVFVQKETNTRYKVYELTPTQKELIGILSRQTIIIPEQGRKRLSEALGGISKFATVHSDLLTEEQESAAIKKIKSDNRIRVQLLPFGDGLKAELFSKPFGAHPPYCKPGVGGKALISNEKGLQLRTERDLKTEKAYAAKLFNDIQAIENVDTSNDLISFDNPLDSLNLLDVVTAHKDICVVEWPEGERFKLRGKADMSQLSLTIKSKTNWFELSGELKIDEKNVLSLQQFLALANKSHGRFIELKDGEFVALSNELKKRIDELYSFAELGKDALKINKFASLALGDFFDDAENLKADKNWKEFRQRIHSADIAPVKIPSTLQAELRPYQEEGFRWMARLAEWEGGACLADDMGLGKTVQAIAMLLHRRALGAALVVCPVSVLGNWINEITRFAPTLHIKTLGNGNRAETMRQLEAGDVLISTYGLLQSEEELFAQTSFATVVLDEAHVIKNFATKTSKAIMRLQASFRVVLTGTPLQNHLGELWNLFNFINPGLLGGMQHFNETFVKPEDELARKRLKKLITPFILRRTKSMVLDELPPKTEILKKIQLSPDETAFYEALRRQAILNLEASDANQGAKHLQALAEITKLRQASCHPALVNTEINLASSKLSAFLEIVDELTENNHRALVFSQFVSHLGLIRRALDERGVTYQYLDGSTPIAERERNVKKFQNGEGDLFLISLKAGGLGLNLTAADYVIHMDPWWNPAVEDQASDRTHRIGQTRPVTIYRLIAENTIEEKIIDLHRTKRDLADSLLEGSDQAARLSLNELVALIKEG